FGAGGNRDKTKRPLMGKVAQSLADLVIITSDNPRFEEPMYIIEDILKGIENRSKVLIEEDRKKAIELAISIAKEGDVIVVAGKGHEDYQEIKGIKYPFKDSDVVKEALGV
ncbi:MAG: glutamate ligase domain-containing protein, partial [Aquificaceae bacterium]